MGSITVTDSISAIRRRFDDRRSAMFFFMEFLLLPLLIIKVTGLFSTICFLLSRDIGSKFIAEYTFSEIFTQPLMYGHTNMRSVVTEIDISVTNSDCKIFLQGLCRVWLHCHKTAMSSCWVHQVSSVKCQVSVPWYSRPPKRMTESSEAEKIKKKSSAWNQLYTKVNGKESLNSLDKPSFTGLREDNRV